MQAEDAPPPTYQESTPSGPGSASSSNTGPILFGTVEVFQHEPLAHPILNTGPLDESDDQCMAYPISHDIYDQVNARRITLPWTLGRIVLSRWYFMTLISVSCTMLLLFCIANDAVAELNGVTSTFLHLATGETLRLTSKVDVSANVALNFTTSTACDTFLVLSTTVSNTALNWQKLHCEAGHASSADRRCPLFDALTNFASAATASSRDRQMLLATLEGILDATTDIMNGTAVGTGPGAPEASVRHFVVDELHSKLTRAITAIDTFGTTLLAAHAALGRVRLHCQDEGYSRTTTTNAILAVIRGSGAADVRKKDLLRQLNDWDAPALAYVSSMQQVAFQIKARLVELGEQVHRLGNLYDGKVIGWQAAVVERVGRRVEHSISILRG